MATKLNDKYLSGFIGEHEYDGVAAKLKQLTRCCMTAAASATTFWVGSIFLQIMTRKSSHASRSVQRKSRRILMYSL